VGCGETGRFRTYVLLFRQKNIPAYLMNYSPDTQGTLEGIGVAYEITLYIMVFIVQINLGFMNAPVSMKTS